jgi:hypothetical protein
MESPLPGKVAHSGAAMQATLSFAIMTAKPDPDDPITRIREPENTVPARLPL